MGNPSDNFDFATVFQSLTGHEPFPWQTSLYDQWFAKGRMPRTCDLPTGLGKTAVIAVWLISLANHPGHIPRRLAYVVNRRTVVDQTTDEVEKLRRNLRENKELKDLKDRLGALAISTLRGQFADNREWSADPSRPAVICGTVDMIGSRLLFGGYRLGFRSRPLHAGFLGQDVLLVHDESHLEPAFQQLLETVEREQRESENTQALSWPKLRVMALSATARSTPQEQAPESDSKADVLRLTPEDHQNPEVIKRINANKQLTLHAVPTKDKKNGKEADRKPAEIEKQLLSTILEQALSHQKSNQAILIFLRKVDDVEAVAKELPQDSTQQLTGTLRGLERDALVKDPVFQRFLPKSNRDPDITAAQGTVYLVCTSAGEVGVNISADHLVCDLSTFDSMAQRFGRVNRFGDRDDTRMDVVYPETFGKKNKSGKIETSELDERREKTLQLLQQLNGSASPAAIDRLDAHARREAFAPEPTILPATDILFDAWSLTTIRDQMPGRPPVEPYLHGVNEGDPPQTQVAWREEVGIITGDLLDRYNPQDLLDDYPLKPHELLRDRSDRVYKHLGAIAKRHPQSSAWLVEEQGKVSTLTLEELADKKEKDRISGKIVLLPPEVGGLENGLLNGKAKNDSNTRYDVADAWFADIDHKVKRRIRQWDDDQPLQATTSGMALIRTLDFNPNADEFDDSDASEDDTPNNTPGKRFWHWYARPRDAEDATCASAKPITWDHHTQDVVTRTTDIIKQINLPDDLHQALVLAANLHDLGKKRELWQRSIGNPDPTDWHAKPGKPDGAPRWKPRRISTYRHEFGSLLDTLDPNQEYFAQFRKLSNDLQDVVLHLIAAHHGYARPHFPPHQCIDPAPGHNGLAAEQALETPRRFARLQRRFGRWGLAYLESLLRAADWAASAEPSPWPEKTKEANA